MGGLGLNTGQPDKALSPVALHTLELIYGQFAVHAFSQEQLEELRGSLSGGAELCYGLRELRLAGIVQAVQKAWGDKLYYLPLEAFVRMHKEKLAFHPNNTHCEMNVQLWIEAKSGLADELLKTLAWIARGDLPLTAKGIVHQRAVNKFADALLIKEEDLAGLKLRYPQQEHCPPGAAVMLDLVQALGLAQKGNHTWIICEQPLISWLSLNSEQMNFHLLLQLLERYVPAITDVEHFTYGLFLLPEQPGQWQEIRAVKDRVSSHNMENKVNFYDFNLQVEKEIKS